MVSQTEHAAPADFPAGPPAAPRDTTFLADPIVDHLLRAVITLTMELSVTRERLRALEQVVGGGTAEVSARIDALAVDGEEDAARRSERERLISAILGPLVARLSQAD